MVRILRQSCAEVDMYQFMALVAGYEIASFPCVGVDGVSSEVLFLARHHIDETYAYLETSDSRQLLEWPRL